MARRAGDSLRQHMALKIEDAGGKIAGLPHDGAEGRAQQSLRLLLDNGEEAVPHDLAADGGDAAGSLGQAGGLH